MPLLVYRRTDAHKPEGVYAVAWTWMPHFLASDTRLHRQVDEELMTRFAGERFFTGDQSIMKRMSQAVIEIVTRQYPIFGLSAVLLAIEQADASAEEKQDAVAGQTVHQTEGVAADSQR